MSCLFAQVQTAFAEDGSPERAPIYVAFSYEAERECLDEEQAFSLVHRRSRRVVRAREQTPTQELAMRIVGGSAGYRGVLTVTRPDESVEQRAMTGQSCDEVVEALALTAALSIDPQATLTLGPAEGTESPEEDVGDEPLPPGRAARSPVDAGVRFTGGVSLTTQRVMNHSMHLGGGVVLGVSRPGPSQMFPLEARVSLRAFLEPAPMQPGIKTTFYSAQIAYCPVRLGSEQVLLICPTAELSLLSARSRGFEQDSRVLRSFVSVGIEAWLRAHLSQRWELWVSPALLAPLTRRDFAVDPGPKILVATLPLAWAVSTGVGYRF